MLLLKMNKNIKFAKNIKFPVFQDKRSFQETVSNVVNTS